MFKEIGNFASYLGNQLNDLPTFLLTLQNEILKALKFLPDSIYTSVSENITQFFGNLINDFDVSKLGINMSSITSTLTSGISGVYSVVKNIPSIIIAVVIGIIACILFTKDYKRVVRFIKLQLPDKHKNLLSETKKYFRQRFLKCAGLTGLLCLSHFARIS